MTQTLTPHMIAWASANIRLALADELGTLDPYQELALVNRYTAEYIRGIRIISRPTECLVYNDTKDSQLHKKTILAPSLLVERDAQCIIDNVVLPGGKEGGRRLTPQGLFLETRRGWKYVREVPRIVAEYNHFDYYWVDNNRITRALELISHV